MGASDSIDLQSTLTHEIGHALGLGHSDIAEATMAPSIIGGDISKRTLDQDDINGICALYPVHDDPQQWTPPHCGLDLTGNGTPCDSDDGDNTQGCSYSPSSKTTATLYSLIF